MISASEPIELSIDLETFSSVDIKFGAYRYAEAPDFDILLIGYHFSDEDSYNVIDCTKQDANGNPELCRPEHARLLHALVDPHILKSAFNANFERTCLAKYLKRPMPPDEWRCTMILASSLGLPRSLKDVGIALGLPEDEQKDRTGRALIQYFCKPCKPTRANGGRARNLPIHAPEKWELFKNYNRQDVVTEQSILRELKRFRPEYDPKDPKEQHLWSIDQEINDYGVDLDIDMARKIVDFDTHHGEDLLNEAKKLTGLSNPNSVPQLRQWLALRGVGTDSLAKAAMADLIKMDLPEDVRRVLEIRQTLSKTSVKKYQTMLDMACPDGRARGMMQFYGGHTGRWAGRGLQPQNLSKNVMPDPELDEARALVKAADFDTLQLLYGEPAPVFSQLVRTGFIPSEGCRFVVSDFSAIEARVIAWVSGEDWRLDVFRNGGDIYCESASHIYHVPVVKHGINGELRQRGKVAELALGYGGGVGAMKRMDTTGSVDEAEMPDIVRMWRNESPKIVKMWTLCEKAAIKVIMGKMPAIKIESLQGLTFYMDTVHGTPVMFIRLPSGRPIAYWDPQIIDDDYGNPHITYMSQNQTTRKWERVETYGGKLTENIIQSIARDCLAEKMMTLTDQCGYHIVFHVHDEMILDIPRADKDAADTVDRIMADPIDWAPGLPLKGGTYECDFYRKD